jgi:hypothetical protein
MGTNIGSLDVLKNRVFDYVKSRLGDKMVEIDLEPFHYEQALTRAQEVLQTRSAAATEESFAFLAVQNDVQIYTLPEEIQYVLQIWRRSLGDLGNGGSEIDPFSQGYLNVYILNAGRSGGLLNYELFKDYEFQVDRMFGGQIDYNYNSITKELTLIRKPCGENERLLLQTYNFRPLVQLLSDPLTLTFFKEYTYALCLSSLGHARAKYNSLISPGGGTSLDGASLIAESQALMTELDTALSNYRFGGTPLSFIIG